MGPVTSRTVSYIVQSSLMITTCQRQLLGSRHPCKMVFPLRVTLQSVLWKNTLHPALYRMATERRLLTKPGSRCARRVLGGWLLSSRSMAEYVVMQCLPGWMTKICMLGCVIDTAGVVFLRRVTDAAMSTKAVCSNSTGLAQPGSFKIRVIVELTKLLVVME
jgi:hypothetical protein